MQDGETCEVNGCGALAVIVLQRRESGNFGLTHPNTAAPRHPRCGAHCGTTAAQLDDSAETEGSANGTTGET